MIQPSRAYELYNAIRLHFTSKSYDYHRYDGTTNISKNGLDGRKDKYFFQKFASKVMNEEEAICVLVSNFSKDKKTYIRSIDYDYYSQWRAYKESLVYSFKNNLDGLFEYAHENGVKNPLAINDEYQYSFLVSCLLEESITMEFFIILNIVSKGTILKGILKDNPDDIILQDIVDMYNKYYVFLNDLWGITKQREKLFDVTMSIFEKYELSE